MFDAPAYLAAFDAPTYIDQAGKKHVGRILGADHWLRLQIKMRARNDDGTPNYAEIERNMARIVNDMFPRAWWKVWERSVFSWLRQLPPMGRMQAVWDFMGSQAKAMGSEPLGTFQTAIQHSDKPADLSPVSPISG